MLDEAVRGLPLAECTGIGQCGATADDCTGRLEVGSRFDEGVEYGYVVAAGRPVQRRLSVGAVEPGVGIGSSCSEGSDNRGPVGEVARPVGCDVEEVAGSPASPL